MRFELFFSGMILSLLGILFYFLQLPFIFFWSIPFGIAGVIMMIASPFLRESRSRVSPPEGFQFCVYCSSLMPEKSERCPNCNGKQPRND